MIHDDVAPSLWGGAIIFDDFAPSPQGSAIILYDFVDCLPTGGRFKRDSNTTALPHRSNKIIDDFAPSP